MKANHWALALSLAAAFTVSAAKADDAIYSTADAASVSCGADQVVWIDLDRGRYYAKGQANFGKSSNGVYACETAARRQYREAKSEPSAVATSK